MRLIIVGALALAAAACVLACESLFPKCDDPTRPCPDVSPDYPPGPTFGAELEKACAASCQRLRELGCPEGSGTLGGEQCAVTCIRASALRPLPLACWSDAGDAVAAKSCGSLRCIR